MKSDSHKQYLHGVNILIGMAIGYCEGKGIALSDRIKGTLVATPLLSQYSIEMTLGYLKLQSAKKKLESQREQNKTLTPKMSAMIPGASVQTQFLRGSEQERLRATQNLENRVERLQLYKTQVPVQVGYSALEMAAGYVIGFAFSRLPL